MIQVRCQIHHPVGLSQNLQIEKAVLVASDLRQIDKSGAAFLNQGTPVQLSPDRAEGIHQLRVGKLLSHCPDKSSVQLCPDFFLFKNRRFREDDFPGGTVLRFAHIRPHHDIRVIFAHCVHRVFAGVRLDPVVRVHEHDVFPAGAVQRVVPRPGYAAVRLIDDLYPRILIRVPPQDIRTAVTGAVVDADNFQIRVCLVNHTAKALCQIPLHVVNGNDNADQRLILHLPAPPVMRRL